MPTATVTVREVRNKDTGIDLTVPTFKEVKGMLASTFYYRVVVVSNLQVFKSTKHRDTDTVQFMVEKKFAEFEDLYDQLNGKFSGTVLPPLPKKVLLVNEPIARARRAELEHFLKFIASVPKLCTSPVLLQFLGVGSLKAGAFRKGEVGGEEEGEKAKKGEAQEPDTKQPETNLFDEEEDAPDGNELFGAETEEAEGTDYTGGESTQLFDAPDLGGGISEEDDSSLFLPDAVVEKKVAPTLAVDESDPSLYQIDQDLEDIMKIDLTKKSKDNNSTIKPKLKPKPKPALKPKPGSKPEAEEPVTNISSDDILSYIQNNDKTGDDDLDLFS